MTQIGREIMRPQWGGDHIPDIRQYDTVRFADLADTSFRDINLEDVTFFGCQLNGASFVGSRMNGTSLIGCFAFRQAAAVSFGPDSSMLNIRHTHLGRTDYPIDPTSRWPSQVAEAAWRAVAGNNVERYRAILEIGELGHKPVAPFVVSLLNDEEWDVRSAVLQALERLRGDGFPDDDAAILRTAFEALGDENSLVTMNALDFVESAGAPFEPLLHVVQLVQSNETDSILIGLRSIVSLSSVGDPAGVVASIFDGAALLELAHSSNSMIRAEYLHALGAANLNIERAWKGGLRDPDPEVRARAISAIRLLDDPPSAQLIEPFVHDPAEGVRIEALFTLGHIGDFDRNIVGSALNDSSEQVRHYAAMLLEN